MNAARCTGRWRAAATWVALIALAFVACARDRIVLDGGWARLPAPGASTVGGYLSIDNREALPIRITGVSSEAFGHAMLHATRVEDGVARMLHVDGIDVAPGARVDLAPGGLHVMLVDPVVPVTAGAIVPLTLELADGRFLPTTLEVRAP